MNGSVRNNTRMTHEVIVYSLDGSPHCRTLKGLLATQDVHYTNYAVGKDKPALNKMI